MSDANTRAMASAIQSLHQAWTCGQSTVEGWEYTLAAIIECQQGAEDRLYLHYGWDIFAAGEICASGPITMEALPSAYGTARKARKLNR